MCICNQGSCNTLVRFVLIDDFLFCEGLPFESDGARHQTGGEYGSAAAENPV